PRDHAGPDGLRRRDGAPRRPEPRRAPTRPDQGVAPGDPSLDRAADPSRRAMGGRRRPVATRRASDRPHPGVPGHRALGVTDGSPRARLRRLVVARAGLVVPGAYDGVSARLVERAAFEAGYMTGYGTSASRLGLPDLGFAGLADMVENVRQVAAAVTIPLIADADTSYDSPLSVERTVRAYETAGAAELHLEC